MFPKVGEKNSYGLIVKIAVLCLIMAQYSKNITSPLLFYIKQDYSSLGFWIKQIETINFLLMAIVALSNTILLRKFRKKHLAIFGAVAVSIGCILPTFYHCFAAIFVGRMILGIGTGIVMPFAAAWIIDLFDGRMAEKMMGARSWVGGIFGMCVTQASSRIFSATGSYWNSFNIGYVALALAIFMFLFLPKDPSPVAAKAGQNASDTTEPPSIRDLSKTTWIYLGSAVLYMLFAFTFFTNISIVVVSKPIIGGLGLTAPTVGNMITVFSFTIMISGLLFGYVWMPLFKNYAPGVGALASAIGLFGMFSSHSATPMYVSIAFFGLGFQIYNSGLMITLGKSCKAGKGAALAISYAMALSGLGQWLSSVIISGTAAGLWGDAIRGDWKLAGPLMALFGVGLLILTYNNNKNTAKAEKLVLASAEGK